MSTLKARAVTVSFDTSLMRRVIDAAPLDRFLFSRSTTLKLSVSNERVRLFNHDKRIICAVGQQHPRSCSTGSSPSLSFSLSPGSLHLDALGRRRIF